MATGLFTPILNDRTRAPYFFNGRLLSGEAMTDEQRAQAVAHELLAQGLGDGVAHGLQVAIPTALNTVDRPVASVKAGLAINRKGNLLYLAKDTDVQLVRPAHESVAPRKLFEPCLPPQQGTYVADAGVYLLTVSPIGVGEGLAPVSGLGGPQRCNVKDRVDAVQFRLVELPIGPDVLADTPRLRNRVAYACFGVSGLADFARDPFGPGEEPATLLDEIRGRSISDCDVPLAVLHWTATGGIQFLDMWSVRRRLTRTRVASSFPALSDQRRATSEAMVLQFEEQIETLRRTAGNTGTLAAIDFFRFLPPVGILPIASASANGFSQLAFFDALTVRGPAFVEGARLQTVLGEALAYAPIDTNTKELIWLYLVRENRQAIDQGRSTGLRSVVVFASGHVPYRADAHYDVAKWNYSSYL